MRRVGTGRLHGSRDASRALFPALNGVDMRSSVADRRKTTARSEATGAGRLDEPANARIPEPLSNRKAAWLLLTFLGTVVLILIVAMVLLPR